MIELKNVWKIYRKKGVDVIAIKDITLTIGEHEYITIIGPSGSGKTTLLNIIGTIDLPTKGDVFFNGENITKINDIELSKFRRKQIGFVFQSYNLIPDLTAWENVSLPLYYDGIRDKKERRKRALEMLDKVNLLHRANHYPSELSGGEEQRVAIARALVNNPKLLLADEPTGNLDTKTSNEIIDLFEKLYEQNKITLIIVTHNLKIAERASKKIKLIDGEIVDIQIQN